MEGVLIDLDRAYAAENHEELIAAANQTVSSKAKAEERFADPAISRGSTSYPIQKSKRPTLNADELEVLRGWKMTEEEYFNLPANKAKYGLK